MKAEYEYIYAIYQYGSLSEAARKLFLSQPALSKALKRTEDSIGMALFDRSSRPVRLTEAGRAYIRAIETMRKAETTLEHHLSELSGLREGSLRIGGTHYVNAHVLPKALTRFHSLYPGIRTELIENSSVELGNMLAEGKLDITFSCDPRRIALFPGTPCFSDHILLAVPEQLVPEKLPAGACCSAEDILAGRHLADTCPVVDITAFAQNDFILLKEGNNLRARAEELFRSAGITPRCIMSLDQLATAYYLCAAGYAAAFISDRLVKHSMPGVCFFRPDSPAMTREFHALFPSGEYIPQAASVFADIVLQTTKPDSENA